MSDLNEYRLCGVHVRESVRLEVPIADGKITPCTAAASLMADH